MIDDARIDAIVEQVMSELRQGERVRHGPPPEIPALASPPTSAPAMRHGDNLFPDVDSAVEAANEAYRQLFDLPLSVREQMISHIRRISRENAHLLAQDNQEVACGGE